MRKFPIYLVLFFLFFSYSFILVAPIANGADCYCICNITEKGTMTSQSVCEAECQKMGAGYLPASCGTDPNAGTNKGTNSSCADGQVCLTDPLKLNGDPTAFWGRLIGALLAFVGVGALVTFVYAGFMFLTSSGNPEQVKKAKDTMLYAVIGVAVSMGAYVILSYIFDILQNSVGQK